MGTRNTPTILNAVFSEFLFWDGRARSLEDQVKHPLLSSFEMGMGSQEQLTNRLAAIADYRRQSRLVFNSEGITIDTIAGAIAAYERTLLSGNSRGWQCQYPCCKISNLKTWDSLVNVCDNLGSVIDRGIWFPQWL